MMAGVVRLITVLLCTFVLLSLVFQVVQAAGSEPIFSEHFDGSTVDLSIWQVHEQNLNLTGYPAWGGSVRVADGYVHMSSNGSTFPFMQTLQNPFPATGDFAIQFNLTYTAIADRGAGLMIGNGTPTMDIGPFGTDIWRNRIFTLWAADKSSENHAMIYIELFNRFVYEIDYSGFKPSSPSHLYKLAYTQGVYHVYVNGVEVANAESDVRPTTIIIGTPPIPRLPLSPADTARWAYWGWSSFTVDFISMMQASEISLSVGTQAQLGSRVNLSGNLAGRDGDPLGNAAVSILYTIPGMSTWYPLAAAKTDSSGFFSVAWIPSANGEFRLKALWSGDDLYVGAFVEKNVSVLNDQNENALVAESNSTLSSLSFNLTAREISFKVSGSVGTFGYVRFVIPKLLLSTLTDFKVHMDGQEVNFTTHTVGDSHVLYFEYHHSTHEVTISIPAAVTPEFEAWILLPLLVLSGLATLLIRKKKVVCTH